MNAMTKLLSECVSSLNEAEVANLREFIEAQTHRRAEIVKGIKVLEEMLLTDVDAVLASASERLAMLIGEPDAETRREDTQSEEQSAGDPAPLKEPQPDNVLQIAAE